MEDLVLLLEKEEKAFLGAKDSNKCKNCLIGHFRASVMPALKRTRLTASAWRKTNWCINCVLMRVMERRERDNS